MKRFILALIFVLGLSLVLSQDCNSCLNCIKSGGGNGCVSRCPSSCSSDPCAKCVLVYKGGSACKDKAECKSSSGGKNKIANVPYFYQYNNRNNPGGTCQITTMAMTLSFYGVNVTPDYLYNQFFYSNAKDPSGWASEFDEIAKRNGVKVRAEGKTYGSLDAVKAQIQKGFPVPVFGYFTGGGHVMLVVGYTDNTVICNDPAGTWSQQYKYGGYSGWETTEGKYIQYDKSAFKYAMYAASGYADSDEAEFWYVELY